MIRRYSALSHGKGLSKAAVEYARDRFGKDDDDERAPAAGGRLEEGAEQVERALRRQDVAEQVAEFDARLDARLGPPRG